MASTAVAPPNPEQGVTAAAPKSTPTVSLTFSCILQTILAYQMELWMSSKDWLLYYSNLYRVHADSRNYACIAFYCPRTMNCKESVDSYKYRRTWCPVQLEMCYIISYVSLGICLTLYWSCNLYVLVAVGFVQSICDHGRVWSSDCTLTCQIGRSQLVQYAMTCSMDSCSSWDASQCNNLHHVFAMLHRVEIQLWRNLKTLSVRHLKSYHSHCLICCCSALQEIFRKDYKPTSYLIPNLTLDFQLNEDYTRVKSKLQVTPNYKEDKPPPLELHGERLYHRFSDIVLAFVPTNWQPVKVVNS